MDFVKSEDVFYIERELAFLAYKYVSNHNYLTKEYRTAMTKKSVSTNQSFFMNMQAISADLSLRYEPHQIENDIKMKINEYLMNPEKNIN